MMTEDVSPPDVAGLREELAEARRLLERRTAEWRELLDIGLALSSERDLGRLQDMILRAACRLTSADAGTLYLVDKDDGGQPILVFTAAHNDSIDAPYQRMTMPLDTRSVAGFAATRGLAVRLDDAYRLPSDAEYSFSTAFDERFGYLTRSMLVVPMRDYHGAAVGVIQLINRKRHAEARLRDRASVEREVEPFADEHEGVLASFASQAAVALENKILLEAVLRREELLKREVAHLRVEIDLVKQERQVAEITETDYFQSLQEKARALRARKA